jgi:hypothetical protein
MKYLAAFAVVAFVAVGVAQAADKPNPTGTWKWTVGNNNREVTLKLKLDGDKLTGSMPGRNNQETKIEDASFKDGEISFKVTRKNNQGQEIVTTYTGKVEGDTIKGKIKRGDAEARDWEAKRAKD